MKVVLPALALFTVMFAGQIRTAQAIDIVTRKSDKPAQGDIASITRDAIVVKPGVGADISVPANDVVSVRWGSEPVNLNLGRSAEEGGDLDRAIGLYQESAKDAEAKGDIKVEIEFLITRATARKAVEQNGTDAAKATAGLDAFIKGNGSNFRYYQALMLLGEVQLAAQDFDAAQQSFNTLSQAPWNDYQMAAQNSMGYLALKRGDNAAALAAFDAVLAKTASGPAEVSRRNEALLGKASVQVMDGSFDAALAAVAEAIKAADPEDSVVQARAYVLKGDCFKNQGKLREAILAYLHVPVLFEREKLLHAEALFNLSQLWPRVDEADRGLAAAQELRETYPESPWTQKLQ